MNTRIDKEGLLSQLSVDIQKINDIRKRIGAITPNPFIMLLIIIACIVAEVFLLKTEFINIENFVWLVIFTVFGVFAFIESYKRKKLEPVRQMVNKLRAKMMHLINEDFDYIVDEYIKEDVFASSGLINKSGNKYSGSNLVKGKLGNTKFMMSHIKYEDEHGSGKSHHYELIFDGFFLVAEFNKNFKGRTVVLKDIAENFFGDVIGSWLQKNNLLNDRLVKLENPVFEKKFVVYSNDQIEARYLLSPLIMEKLVDLDEKYNSISISFIDNKLFAVLPSIDEFTLEIPYEELIEDENVWFSFQNMNNLVETISAIINELGLNNKLWADDIIESTASVQSEDFTKEISQ